MTPRIVVYDTMTTSEEEKLRSIEKEVLACLDSAGRTNRHFWTIEVREGIRYIRFGNDDGTVHQAHRHYTRS